jgi:hypothetical protein
MPSVHTQFDCFALNDFNYVGAYFFSRNASSLRKIKNNQRPIICPGVCTCNADRYGGAWWIQWKHNSGSLSNARIQAPTQKIVKTAHGKDSPTVKLARKVAHIYCSTLWKSRRGKKLQALDAKVCGDSKDNGGIDQDFFTKAQKVLRFDVLIENKVFIQALERANTLV